MITSFDDKRTQEVFEGKIPKGFRSSVVVRARKILERIHAVHVIGKLKFPPSYRLHKLDGGLRGYWSESVNMAYRLIFRFKGNDASEVRFVDYR
jgi:proteic killer suppression protein